MYHKNVEGSYLYFDLNKVMEDKKDGQYMISQFVSKNYSSIFGDYPFSVYQHLTLELKQRQSM